ncbi:MAG: type II secretion system protein GspN [Desulfobacteraceae bacterium]|jgi:type II secretion system protein N
MKRTTKIFLYIVFTMVALVFFLYHRFPSEMVFYALSGQIARLDPKVQLDTNSIRPTLPPGLKLEPLSVNYAQIPIMRMDFLKVKPELLSLFSRSKRYNYTASMGGGKLRGRADTIIENNREQSKFAITVEKAPLDYIDIFNHWKNYQTNGELDANIRFDSLKSGGTADVSIEISPAQIEFEPALMGIESLDFTKLNTQLVITQRMLQIKNCEAFGNQLEGKITGSIIFREPIEESRISMTLTLKPQPAFIAYHKSDMIGGVLASANAQKRGVVFRISGTLNNPRYVIR